MQRDTIFRIASMTKPVTVAAAMALIEEGKLALTDPVAEWLPELADMRVLDDPRGPLDRTVPAQRPITVDDLMTHRSGLAYVFSVLGPLAGAYAQAVAPPGPGPLAGRAGRASAGASARRAADLQPRHRRARHRRCRASRASRCSDVLTERILGPLGHARHRLQRRPDRPAPGRHDVPARRRQTRCSHDVMGPAPIVDPPFCSGGAGSGRRPTTICASPGCCWAAATLDGVRVLSEESVATDAHRPADRRAEASRLSRSCRTGSAAGSG